MFKFFLTYLYSNSQLSPGYVLSLFVVCPFGFIASLKNLPTAVCWIFLPPMHLLIHRNEPPSVERRHLMIFTGVHIVYEVCRIPTKCHFYKNNTRSDQLCIRCYTYYLLFMSYLSYITKKSIYIHICIRQLTVSCQLVLYPNICRARIRYRKLLPQLNYTK